MRLVDGDSPDFNALAAALDADLISRYPALAEDPPLPVEHLRVAVVAYLGEAAVACGALREIEPDIAEIKRMFVVPESRGQGIGRLMLEFLEARARTLGYMILRLGTGTRQPEALSLYESSGFHRIPLFGEYEAGGELCACYQKVL